MKKWLRNLIGEHLYLGLHTWRKKVFDQQAAQAERVFSRRVTFYSTFVSQGDLCFDVGANIGNRIDPLLSIGAKVVAIEPQQKCYEQLRKKYGNKIEIVTKGLGEKDDKKEFYISDAHTISSFSKEFVDLVKKGRFKEHTWNESVEIEITTLDALIERYGLPAFIKIDVEGYELEVLKGLNSPINMISFEYMVPEQTQKVVQCIEEVEKHSPAIECNYSIGESMEFALTEWLSPREMKKHVSTSPFTNSLFGDVYCRQKVHSGG